MGAASATRHKAAPSRRPRAIVSAVTVGAAVLPVSALCAWVSDRDCNHLEGNVEMAEAGTPRGSWCSAVEPGHSWVPLLLAPALLATVLMLALSRWRGQLLYSAAPGLRAGPGAGVPPRIAEGLLGVLNLVDRRFR